MAAGSIEHVSHGCGVISGGLFLGPNAGVLVLLHLSWGVSLSIAEEAKWRESRGLVREDAVHYHFLAQVLGPSFQVPIIQPLHSVLEGNYGFLGEDIFFGIVDGGGDMF